MAAGIIQLLPDHVANQIAAGEVVQRPASVVKELLENAIDSGALHVTLNTKEAGKTLIQVIDNGKGIVAGTADETGNGMKNMRQRIGLLNGSFSVKSQGGLTLTFEIPIQQAIL